MLYHISHCNTRCLNTKEQCLQIAERQLNLEFYIHPTYPPNMKKDTKTFSNTQGFSLTEITFYLKII